MQQPLRSGDTITALRVNIYDCTVKETYILHEIDGIMYVKNLNVASRFVQPIGVLKNALIFFGSNIPYKTDRQLSSFVSNSCINIFDEKNEPEKIRQWLEEKNLNPHFTNWESICLCYINTPGSSPVYKKLKDAIGK